jgi:hypothetical protein
MRRKLIEALTFPRLFILENIDLEDCPQDRNFDTACERCRSCDLGQECHWLSCLNNFNDLASKPIHTLHASLLYSINLIENWTRDAQELSQEFSRRFVWVFNSDQRTQQSR